MQLCEKPSKWALHVVKPLPFCVRNRVALIGDAVGLSRAGYHRHVPLKSFSVMPWRLTLLLVQAKRSMCVPHNSVVLSLKRYLGCVRAWPAHCASAYDALARPRCPPHLRRDSAPICSFRCQSFVIDWMDVHVHGTRLLRRDEKRGGSG